MATCTGDKYTQQIDRTECIGNSLSKINSNFLSLDKAVCGLEQNVSNLTQNQLLTSVIGISPIVVTGNNSISVTNATQTADGTMSAADKTKLDGLVNGVPLSNFIGSNQSLTTNGYQKLPGGLILQWGKLAAVNLNQTFYSVTYPIAFPTNALNVQATVSYLTFVTGSLNSVVKDITKIGFSVGGDHTSDTRTGDIYWFAIGI